MGIEKKRMYCPEENKYVLAERTKPNHLLHLVLTLLTFGLWLIVWILVSFSSGLSSYRCPSCGARTKSAFFNKVRIDHAK